MGPQGNAQGEPSEAKLTIKYLNHSVYRLPLLHLLTSRTENLLQKPDSAISNDSDQPVQP